MIRINLYPTHERKRAEASKRTRDRYRTDPEYRESNRKASAERRARVRADPEAYAQLRADYKAWRKERRKDPAYVETERKNTAACMRRYRQTERGRQVFLNNRLRYAYGITLEDVREMLRKQRGLCEVCSTPLRSEGRGADRLCVDHNHTTGAVRGLLCTRCNTALGMVREDVNVLCALAEYLEKYNEAA